MSSTINSVSQNSDMQAMILSMFNKINSATINAAQKSALSSDNDISVKEFAKTLEEQLKKSVTSNLDNEKNLNQNVQTGMPAGMTINENNDLVKESYQALLQSIIENLDKNSDGKITQEEMKDFAGKISKSDTPETTGSLASSNVGDFLKNQAGNFIQKLIDRYKDNSESILGIFV